MATTEKAATNGHTAFAEIEISKIVLSGTNPRTVFHQSPLGELAASIKSKGILEPLLVRPKADRFELIAGERRLKAATIAELTKVPVIVRELSDEDALDIQIEENLHREDIEPMDEARGYKFLMEKTKLNTPEELAIRLSKPVQFVLQRLKLNDLTDDLQKLVDEGKLPIGHALEIAKYDAETQTLIQKQYLFTRYNTSDAIVAKPLVELKALIGRDIQALLKLAPFSTEDTRLRKDGLACVACASRTGANPGLFDEAEIKDGDRCLNKPCYEKKIDAFIQIQRKELPEAAGKKGLAPVIALKYYGWQEKSPFKGTVLTDTDNFRVVAKDQKHHCPSTVQAIVATESGNYRLKEPKGAVLTICANKSCEKHWPKPKQGTTANGTASKSSEKELDEKRQRKEESIDARVREIVRCKVIVAAAEAFAESLDVREADTGHDVLAETVSTLWNNVSNIEGRLIQPLSAKWKVKIQTNSYGWTDKSPTAIAKTYSYKQQCTLLFIFIHGHKAPMSGYYKSQAEIIKLAQQFDIDYRLIDAEVRFEDAPKKHKAVFQEYLENVQMKNPRATIPRNHSVNYSKSKSDDAMLVAPLKPAKKAPAKTAKKAKA